MMQTVINCLFSAGATFTGWHLLTAHGDNVVSGFLVTIISGTLWTLTILDFFDRKYSQ